MGNETRDRAALDDRSPGDGHPGDLYFGHRHHRDLYLSVDKQGYHGDLWPVDKQRHPRDPGPTVAAQNEGSRVTVENARVSKRCGAQRFRAAHVSKRTNNTRV